MAPVVFIIPRSWFTIGWQLNRVIFRQNGGGGDRHRKALRSRTRRAIVVDVFGRRMIRQYLVPSDADRFLQVHEFDQEMFAPCGSALLHDREPDSKEDR